MKPYKVLLLSIGVLYSTCILYAQEGEPTDFTAQISKYDLSSIWTVEEYKCVDDEGEEKRRRPEPYGFIGDNYQRFYIHIISAIQVLNEPNKYMVYGKTKVKNNICSFHGYIQVKSAEVYKEDTVIGYHPGIANCEVVLFEDSKQPNSGKISGVLTTWFMLNKNGYFGYYGMEYYSDGFRNNQVIGTWSSYKTGESKKCHWGDYRIPDCGDFDIGAAEFSVDDKYLKYGWENLRTAFIGDYNAPETKKARDEEDRKWWEE